VNLTFLLVPMRKKPACFHVNKRHNGIMLKTKKQTTLLSTVICHVVGWVICCSTRGYENNFLDGTISIDLHSNRSAYGLLTQ